MDRKTLKNAIEDKLEVIAEQFDIIRGHQGKIPAIELDLVMANIRELYELFLYLEKTNAAEQTASREKTPRKELQPLPPVASSPPEKPPSPSEALPDARPAAMKEPDPGSGDKTPDEQVGAMAREKVAFDLFSDSPVKAPVAAAEAVAEDLPPAARDPEPQEVRPTSGPPPLSETVRNNYKDLRSLIGINQKFRFINELFDGNLRIYDETIAKLNKCQASSEAEAILNDLRQVYGWKTSEETAQLFFKAVYERF